MDNEPAFWRQDAIDLRIEAGAILDTHRYVLQEHRIEGLVLERQMQRFANLEVNAVGQFAALRQINGCFNEAGTQVDAYHLTAEGCGRITCRSADAAAKVEYARGRGELGGLG